MSDPLDPLRAAIDLAKAIQSDLDALGVSKAPEEAVQLPHQVPEELRYIMWRYWNDHSGEDHRERYKAAVTWLAGVSVSVQPPSPTVELTPVRIQALKDLLEAADHWSIGATRIAKVIVEEMLAETTPPKSA